MSLPKSVKIIEVGPRDGLQNETKIIPIEIKIDFINRLSQTGLKYIEAGSFVSPKWIPQLADSATLFEKIDRAPQVQYSALVPNLQGFETAVRAKADAIAIFTAASETFTQKNINCSIAESIEKFKPVLIAAKEKNIPVRGYISCVLGCPYEGKIDPYKVADIAKILWQLGCYEISLGDTIGVGTPGEAQNLIQIVNKEIPSENLAVHFHDTYGQALANIYACLELGIAAIDASVAGLGGCPYAPGASGNVATEDVVYMLNGLNIKTGIDLVKLKNSGNFIANYLGQATRSKTAQALH